VDPVEIRGAAGRKQAIHFGPPERPLFGFYHPPAEGPWRDTGVVLCSPIGTDQTRSERTYRHLADRLAAAGFACLRFDLSCTGDSGGGDFGPGIVRTWVEDVRLAVLELRSRCLPGAIALVGLRLGATLAFLLGAEQGDVDSLVLWSPCVSGEGFVGEVTKLHKLYAQIEPHMAGAPKPSADGEEALGVFLPRPVLGELSRIDLLEPVGRPARRVLVIDVGRVPGQEALVKRLSDLGVAPDVEPHLGHKFLITVSHRSLVPDAPIDAIVRWLARAHPMSAAPIPEGAPVEAVAPSGERPLFFGPRRSLFGIWTPADRTRARPDRPAIVLTNAGCVSRVGPHRIYVKMARRWAALGFDVLRVDLSGIGDSPVAPGERENLTYPASGLEDLDAAIGALGGRRAIIGGLCSGGDYAFQLGARGASASGAHEAPAGAWLLNPRTFCVLDLTAVESGVPPRTPVDEVPETLRRMAGRVDTLLIVSRNDPGVAYVDTHAADGMKTLAGVEGFTRVDLDGSDHSFTPVAIQDRVSDLLTERLASRY
jgi:alpha-beta hydrolase superfamily lysophospholipase